MRSTELPPGALSVSKSKNLLFLFGMLVAGAYSGGRGKFARKIFVCVDGSAKIVLNKTRERVEIIFLFLFFAVVV